MEKPEKCAHWQFTKGCLSCGYAPAFVPSVLQTLQQEAREAWNDFFSSGSLLGYNNVSDALIASAFQAGKDAAVNHLLSRIGELGDGLDYYDAKMWMPIFDDARNAE